MHELKIARIGTFFARTIGACPSVFVKYQVRLPLPAGEPLVPQAYLSHLAACMPAHQLTCFAPLSLATISRDVF